MNKPEILGYGFIGTVVLLVLYMLYLSTTIPPSPRTLSVSCPMREEAIESYYDIAATRPLKGYEKARYTEHLIYVNKYCK